MTVDYLTVPQPLNKINKSKEAEALFAWQQLQIAIISYSIMRQTRWE